MGGRGASWNTNSDVLNKGLPRRQDGTHERTSPETRENVVKMFQDIGFTNVISLKGIPDQVANAVANHIQRMSKRMGGLIGVEGGITTIGSFTNDKNNAGHTFAFVQGDRIMIDVAAFANIRAFNAAHRSLEKSGNFAGRSHGINGAIRATLTHELGHVLHNKIAKQQGIQAEELRKKIKDIANKKYRARNKKLSKYANTDEYEFIGEAVAAAYSANPGPYGRAARDVLNLK